MRLIIRLNGIGWVYGIQEEMRIQLERPIGSLRKAGDQHPPSGEMMGTPETDTSIEQD